MSSDCIRLVVVAVTLLLSDVTCQTVHNVSISHDIHSRRQRLQAHTLTDDVISGIVDRHNALRAYEDAANMELMAWNVSLAREAAALAAKCKFEHDRGGQNIAGGGRMDPKNLAPIIDRLYGEKKHYNFDSITCSKVCAHYTQVVWADSRSVGCAFHRCPHEKLNTIMVCNYWPVGNYLGERPYTKGPACSKCANGAGWCKNNLCNPQCSRAGENCLCAAVCYNCAKLDLETCRCKCAKGWDGADCSVRCKNIGSNCEWWNNILCKNDSYVKKNCAARCGLCEADLNAAEGLCPPVRAPGTCSGETVLIKSHQSTMIYVIMVIIAFTIISYDAL